jgi:hypothetical protein
LGELDDNEGTSTTNALELIAEAVAHRLLNGTNDLTVYQWLPFDRGGQRPRAVSHSLA